jgi:hypothetical protein
MLVPAISAAATPSEGVALKVRRGFFTETDIGGFVTLGGNDGYSNFQTYLQLGIGYDVTELIELGLHFGLGSNAQNCFSGRNTEEVCAQSDNFTVTFFDLTAGVLIPISERLYFVPKIAGGYTLLDPAPVVRGTEPVRSGVNAGLGVGIEYATSMDHFSIGLDLLGRFIIGPNIFTLQVFPRVKYTF